MAILISGYVELKMEYSTAVCLHPWRNPATFAVAMHAAAFEFLKDIVMPEATV